MRGNVLAKIKLLYKRSAKILFRLLPKSLNRKQRFVRSGILVITLVFGITILQVLYNPKKASAAWYNPSWSYRKSVTIDYTKVVAAQTDFPVLINLASDTQLAAGAQSDGDDILFTSDDNATKLNHEIEKYSSGTGELIVWVKVPSLSSSTNTVLYMYYGNVGATNQQNATGVWDANYKYVQHLEETGACSVTFTDSTGRNNSNCGNSGPPSAAGKIGNARSYNGSTNNYFIDIPNSTDFDVGSNAFTLEEWVNTSSTSVQDLFASFNSTTPWAGWGVGINVTSGSCGGAGKICIYDGVTWVAGANHGMSTGSWYHVVFVRSGTTVTFYINGSSVGTSTIQTTIPASTASNERIGYATDNVRPYNGTLDEIKFSTTNRSSSWIQTEYNNQNSPSTFYALAAQETVTPSAPTLITPSSGANGVSRTPQFQFRSTDGNDDYLRYEIALYDSSCTNLVGGSTIEQPSGTPQTGWSGQDQQSNTAYTGSASISGSTIATYTYQSNLSFGTTYCWKARAKDPGGSNTYGPYSATQTFTIITNSAPGAPTLSQPTNAATGQSLLPEFRLSSTDTDSDYLQYKIEVCLENTWPCTNGLITIDQTSSQTGWLSQNAATSTAYSSGSMAIHKRQAALTAGTTYYWRAYAKDPAGVDTFSSVSSVSSFTTGAENSNTNIRGGVNIRGGTNIR